MSFKDDLVAAKKKRATEPETQTVDVVLNGNLVVLKFTVMDSMDWANTTARFPMRPNTAIDARYGYNVHGVARAAAPLCGVRVEDGKDVPLGVTRDEKGKVVESEWEDLFDALSGHEFTVVASAIWGLNEWGPSARIEAAKKA